MIYKFIGAGMVILGCGGFGFKMAANHRKEEQNLRQLIHVLDYMECELQYHLTPLPLLCRQAAKDSMNPIQALFLCLAEELEDQIEPNVSACLRSSMSRISGIPAITEKCLLLLGQSLGRFDLSGQIHGFEAVRVFCRQELDRLNENRTPRLRSYQTLGLCVGAALAILFV